VLEIFGEGFLWTATAFIKLILGDPLPNIITVIKNRLLQIEEPDRE